MNVTVTDGDIMAIFTDKPSHSSQNPQIFFSHGHDEASGLCHAGPWNVWLPVCEAWGVFMMELML